MVSVLAFNIFSFFLLLLSAKVVTTQNPVYSALYLVLLFLVGSSLTIVLGLEFMGLLFLLIYAGAIAVLVLFVVMMLDVKIVEKPFSLKKFSLFCVCASFLGLASFSEAMPKILKKGLTSFLGLEKFEPITNKYVYNSWFDFVDPIDPLNNLSYVLYYTHGILLILTGLILLIAMVSAISLTSYKGSAQMASRQLSRNFKQGVFRIKKT